MFWDFLTFQGWVLWPNIYSDKLQFHAKQAYIYMLNREDDKCEKNSATNSISSI